MNHLQLRVRPLFLALAALLGLASLPVLAGATPSDQPPEYLHGVRAEWVAMAGNGPRTDTLLHLINRSLKGDLRLETVVVVGPDGRTAPLATASSFEGRIIPPLGSLRISVNSTHFPGLQVQNTFTAPGARVVLVSWTGPDGALELTSTIVRYPTGDVDQRTSIREESFSVDAG